MIAVISGAQQERAGHFSVIGSFFLNGYALL